MADELHAEVDFFSIGTNDLTYSSTRWPVTVRNPRPLERFADPHSPAVLRMIQMTIEAAHRHGIWCGICGELGADLSLTDTFLRLGNRRTVRLAHQRPASAQRHSQPLRFKVASADSDGFLGIAFGWTFDIASCRHFVVGQSVQSPTFAFAPSVNRVAGSANGFPVTQNAVNSQPCPVCAAKRKEEAVDYPLFTKLAAGSSAPPF